MSNIKNTRVKLNIDSDIQEQINKAIKNGEAESIGDFIEKALSGKYKKISEKVIPSINKIIEEEGNLKGTGSGYDLIFKYIKKILALGINTKDPNKLKVILDNIDDLTYQLNTKKFYVSYPSLSLENYNKLDLTDKLKEIVIPKKINDPSDLEYSTGGNCHNWTLLYKDIFDELGVESKIIVFEPQTAHSLLLLEIDGSQFIADTEGERKFNFKKINIGDSIQIGNNLDANIISINPFKADIIRGQIDIKSYFKPNIYENREDFINFIDNKQRDYYLLEYYSYNEELNKKELCSFMISGSGGKITIIIEGVLSETKTLSLGKRKFPQKEDINNKEYIDFIVKRTNNNIFKNKREESILKGIINKIPKDFIKNLL